METTTDISDRDANNDVINNNHNNEAINVLHDPIHDDVNAVDDDDVDTGVTDVVDTGVTSADDVVGDVSDIVDDGTVANTYDVGSSYIVADDVGSSDTVPGNSNSDIIAETTIEKIDTAATTSNDYDNEVIIDSDNDQPPAEEAVEGTTNVEDDSNDKDDDNKNDKDGDNGHQGSMFNPILSSSTGSDYAFSPSNSATQLSSSSSSKDNYSDRKSGAKLDAIDLCYSVIINGKLKKILKNINFSLEPGCMCALLGSSTAGKR